MYSSTFLVLIVLVTINFTSSSGDIDTSADTDFFDQNYENGLKTPEDYLDPEADASSENILSRKSRSLLATAADLRRVSKGKRQNKGDHKFLITDSTQKCIYVYTEMITGKLQIYQEQDDPAAKGRVLKLIRSVNVAITPNNVVASKVLCPDLNKPKSQGYITIPLKNDSQSNLNVEITLDFSVFRGQYWELTSNSQIKFSGQESQTLKIHHPEEITAGTTFSYSCQSLNIKSPKAKLNGTRAELKLSLTRFHVQPYKQYTQNGKQKIFRPSFDCSTWFTVPLWTGTLVVLLFTAILAMGVIALLDIKTMDRFENPKGKTITIAAAAD